MDKNKILVVKNRDRIIISFDGKKLIIEGDLFLSLKDKSIEDIKNWYLNQ